MNQNRILFVKEAHIHLFLIYHIFGGLWNLGLTNNQLLCHMGFLAYKLIYSILCKQYYLQSALTEEPPIISLYFVSTQPDFLVIFKEWSWAIVLLTFWWSFNVFLVFFFFSFGTFSIIFSSLLTRGLFCDKSLFVAPQITFNHKKAPKSRDFKLYLQALCYWGLSQNHKINSCLHSYSY